MIDLTDNINSRLTQILYMCYILYYKKVNYRKENGIKKNVRRKTYVYSTVQYYLYQKETPHISGFVLFKGQLCILCHGTVLHRIQV